jgi:hypothetical protein
MCYHCPCCVFVSVDDVTAPGAQANLDQWQRKRSTCLSWVCCSPKYGILTKLSAHIPWCLGWRLRRTPVWQIKRPIFPRCGSSSISVANKDGTSTQRRCRNPCLIISVANKDGTSTQRRCRNPCLIISVANKKVHTPPHGVVTVNALA